jgi:hypothetical protein
MYRGISMATHPEEVPMSLQAEITNLCPRAGNNASTRYVPGMSPQPPAIPWPTFPELFVLYDLLTHSLRFRTYYHAERDTIGSDLLWAQDSTLPEGIDYRRTILSNTGLGTTAKVIRLRRIPAEAADAMGVAHELQHFVLDREGYPTVGALPAFETLSAALASMIHDPVVNARLRDFGFDLQQSYDTEVQESIRQLTPIPYEPARAVDRLHWVFNYTGKLLDRELLGLVPDDTADAFQAWFSLRYPTIAAEAHNLCSLITTVGYALPEQQLHLFQTIIQRYHLEQVMVVISDSAVLTRQASMTAHV